MVRLKRMAMSLSFSISGSMTESKQSEQFVNTTYMYCGRADMPTFADSELREVRHEMPEPFLEQRVSGALLELRAPRHEADEGPGVRSFAGGECFFVSGDKGVDVDGEAIAFWSDGTKTSLIRQLLWQPDEHTVQSRQ